MSPQYLGASVRFPLSYTVISLCCCSHSRLREIARRTPFQRSSADDHIDGLCYIRYNLIARYIDATLHESKSTGRKNRAIIMATATYEQIPLDQPNSPKPPQEAATPVTPSTPGFEKKTLLQRLSYGVPTKSPRIPDTPLTPLTPNFEKKSLLKRMTGTYQPTADELGSDPLEVVQKQDMVRKNADSGRLAVLMSLML